MKLARIIAASAAAVVAASAVSLCPLAEDSLPEGYIYFMAEKSTIGQGFTVEPTKVAFYEGETGLDVVQRAAEVVTEDSGYGAYVTAFADTDYQTNMPSEITEVCPEMTGRNTEGYLSAYDYTAESGWTYFINDEYAQVGISDYVPTDGDVICFSFTVYGYGADLGVDNSSWGGAAALITMPKRAELIKLCAEAKEAGYEESYQYVGAMESLAIYNVPQDDVDSSIETITALLNGEVEPAYGEEAADITAEEDGTAEETATTQEVTSDLTIESTDDAASADADSSKGSPSTGVEGVAVAFAAVLLAGAGIALSKKH